MVLPFRIAESVEVVGQLFGLDEVGVVGRAIDDELGRVSAFDDERFVHAGHGQDVGKVGLGVDDVGVLIAGPVLAGIDEVKRDVAGARFLDGARLEDILGAFEELDRHAWKLLLEGVDELLGDGLIVLVPPRDLAFLLGCVV